MLRAILFDFNGVLVDDEPIHLELFQQVLTEEGISLSREDYWEHYLGFDDEGCLRAVYEAEGRELSSSFLVRLIARKASYYRDRIRRDGYPIFPGAVELVSEVAKAELMLGVVSGALRDEVEGALAQLGLRQHFKVLVTAEDVAESKPHPEGYRQGVNLLNSQPPLPDRLLHPHEVLAIEDSIAGLESAIEAGLMTVGVAQTYTLDNLGIADYAVESLESLNLRQLRELSGG